MGKLKEGTGIIHKVRQIKDEIGKIQICLSLYTFCGIQQRILWGFSL